MIQKINLLPSPASIANSAKELKALQAADPLPIGRPGDTSCAPVAIFSPELARLIESIRIIDDERPGDLPSEFLAKVEELFDEASKIYLKEDDRSERLVKLLGKILNTHLDTEYLSGADRQSKGSTRTDAVARAVHEALVLMTEIKNELGKAGDGGLQSYISACKQVADKDKVHRVSPYLSTLLRTCAEHASVRDAARPHLLP